ncbi:hypothetical protein [Halobaculum sp. P14]|uniref:hypothetical protein n=1 Tax=Halobaculum sp. P14 TaxID=3421638 RepID=UPI003EBE8B23
MAESEDCVGPREFEYEPVKCDDCGEFVVVTRNDAATTADAETKFECGCSIGSVGAVKPDSWDAGRFL